MQNSPAQEREGEGREEGGRKRENLFVKSNNDTKSKYNTIYSGRLPEEHYAYQCWPPMTKSKSVRINISKKKYFRL